MGEVRREVQAFALLMEERLAANDHKSHWSGCTINYLLQRLCDESIELERAHMEDATNGARIAHEAADVANFAMMVADVAGGLAAPPPEPAACRPGICICAEAPQECAVHSTEPEPARGCGEPFRYREGVCGTDQLCSMCDPSLSLSTPEPEAAGGERAFTCPECGSHLFGTASSDSHRAPDGTIDTSKWIVYCHGEQPRCRWRGPYDEYVRNDHLSTDEPEAVGGCGHVVKWLMPHSLNRVCRPGELCPDCAGRGEG